VCSVEIAHPAHSTPPLFLAKCHICQFMIGIQQKSGTKATNSGGGKSCQCYEVTQNRQEEIMGGFLLVSG